MPIASYSGSYQPAPMPTSRRPSQTRSSVASAFASTDAGRSASQSTSVPSRTRWHLRRERGQGHDRVEHAVAVGRPAVLRDVEEQVVRQPERVVPGRLRGTRRTRPRSTTAAATRPRSSSRTAGAPVRSAPAALYRGGSASSAVPCSGARVRAERRRRDATTRGSTRSPPRAAPPCSTGTSTATTTGPCSPWPVPTPRTRPARARRARSRRSVDLRTHDGRAPASRRARRGAVRRPRRRRARPTRSTAAREFAAWVADALDVPGVPLRRRRPGGDARCPDARRDAFVRRAPDVGPAAPHPALGAVAVGARPPLVAVNCELDSDDVVLARRIAAAVRERDGGLPGVRALGSASRLAPGGRRCR